jgi:hypothetical protein
VQGGGYYELGKGRMISIIEGTDGISKSQLYLKYSCKPLE